MSMHCRIAYANVSEGKESSHEGGWLGVAEGQAAAVHVSPDRLTPQEIP
eukprot:CAMPEP_0202741322 /NCGR_PEP_ID=MMETSP1388-20130828/4202_1 /ASSEMBLY_ACC=CAM_ASM_000864 /TAXON_ID=37098 /ORGANISM="Isochrysis sp, Strain CCMP1244" /LENGTH=48 /DNA_ID= /DNA_START= /DNA_END= /DNA_ORIENTATION=